MKNKGFTYTVPSDKKVLTPFFTEVTSFRYVEGFKSGRAKDTRGISSQRLYLIITRKSPFGRLAGTGGEINTASLTSGVYFLIINRSGQSSYVHKIVIIR